MSPLGKIFLYIAFAGSLVLAYAGWEAYSHLGSNKADIAQAQQAQQLATQAATKAKQEADAANQAKEAAATELTESKTKVDDLTTKLATAQKAQDDLTSAVQQAKDTAAKAQQDLQKINDSLGGLTVDQMKDKIAKGDQALQADLAEQKILQDQLQASQAQIADLKDAINRAKTGTQPPGISGKITFVNRTWNFVVLNIGLSNGVVPNGELIVYRGRNFLGKIKVTSAEATTAVADILPDAKDNIQIGDDVLN